MEADMSLALPPSGLPPIFKYVDLTGQQNLVTQLKRSFGHILLIGVGGMGQSTIARCIANERNADFREVDSGWLEAQDDTTFVTILTNLSDGQVLHMTNVELLRTAKRELLRQAMSEYKLTLPKATRAAMAGVHPVSLFTLVATCSDRKSVV